jgi:hypothetical protein
VGFDEIHVAAQLVQPGRVRIRVHDLVAMALDGHRGRGRGH